jgi:hypothetical protein
MIAPKKCSLGTEALYGDSLRFHFGRVSCPIPYTCPASAPEGVRSGAKIHFPFISDDVILYFFHFCALIINLRILQDELHLFESDKFI